MAGTQTYITTKSGAQLLYRTAGLAVFTTLPKDSITGERIEGEFANSSFKPKLRTTPALAEQIVAITGPVSTEAKIRKAFETLKSQHQGKAAAPKKAKAKTSVAKAPKEQLAPMPSMDELTLARFEAMEKLMTELRTQMAGKVA